MLDVNLTLLHLSDRGVRPILAYSENTAAYMAGVDARVAGRPGVRMAQSAGAASFAAGLQDAWLDRSPVIALPGRMVLPILCTKGFSAEVYRR